MVWGIESARSLGRWVGLGMAVGLSLAAAGNTWSEDPPGPSKVEVIATGLEAP